MADVQKEYGFTPIAHDIIEALAARVISPDEWRVLMVVFRKTYGWDKKQDWIPLSQFVEITGMGKPHICRALKKLLQRNIIARSGNGVAQTGNASTQVYGIQKDFDKWEGLLPKQATLKRCPNRQCVVAQTGNASLPDQAPSIDTTSIETTSIEKHSCAKFKLFWNAYPKKKSKGQAEKAFEKIKPDAQLLEKMISSIEESKRSEDWMKQGGQFIPYPATWLNAKGWEDEPVEPGIFAGLISDKTVRTMKNIELWENDHEKSEKIRGFNDGDF